MNYYLETAIGSTLHIGKSSYGWCFELHVIPEHRLTSIEAWRAAWSEDGALIRAGSAYDGPMIRAIDVGRIITDRAGPASRFMLSPPPGYKTWAEFHLQNKSQAGPRDLLRRKIGGDCVGHGDGTWDLIAGEFS